MDDHVSGSKYYVSVGSVHLSLTISGLSACWRAVHMTRPCSRLSKLSNAVGVGSFTSTLNSAALHGSVKCTTMTTW